MADAVQTGTICLDISDWDDALRAEYERIVTRRLGAPLTADELSGWLAAVERRNRALAGDAAADPEAAAAGAGLLDRAVELPGTTVVLRLPTMAAEIRIEAIQRAQESGRLTRAQALRRTAYCLAHGGDRAAMAGLWDAAAAAPSVDAWAGRELTCSEEVLEAAVARLREGAYPEPETQADPGATTDWAGLAEALARHCAAPPEHWLYDVPLSQAVWMLRAVSRRQRRQDRAIAEAQGRTAAVDPDAPEVRAIGEYREMRRRLQEMPDMKRETIELEGGRKVQVREMTWGELARVRAEGDTLPMEWPIEQQFAGREGEIAGLGVSEVRTLAEAVYRLSFAAADAPVTAGGSGEAGSARV